MTKKVERKQFENAQYRITGKIVYELPHEFMTCDFPVLKQAPSHKGVPGGDWAFKTE